MSRYSVEWARKNPERIRDIKRRYREKNRERIREKYRIHRAKNRAKFDAQKRAWEKANPQLVSMQRARARVKALNGAIDRSLRYHYGITLQRYEEVLLLQGGVCAICGKFEITRKINRLVVDHDHKSGKLRGLLCHRCNCGLGYFKDDAELVKKAIAYLQKWQQWTP